MIVEYSANNSGGDWWLTDDDWKKLEQAGWIVQWLPQRWLGTLAKEATLECASIEEAQRSFADATGQDPNAEGCPCCGEPHDFRVAS